MVVEPLTNKTYTSITISYDANLDEAMQKFGFIRVIPSDIRDYETLSADIRNFRLYTDMRYLYTAVVKQGIYYKNVTLGKAAEVIPSTKYDLGTRTIELTDIEVFNLKTAFLKEGMKSDVEQRWDELTADGEIPEDINPDFYEILDLAETRQSGDFTYNDAYWRTIEDAIYDYIKEVQNERPE